MQRILLIYVHLIFITSLTFGQITYKDFGEGLIIELNEAYSMDINDDGIVDFYINEHHNELGFTPIPTFGCFAITSDSSYTAFGARELQVFKVGEKIRWDYQSMDNYMENDRGSIFSESEGIVEGWENEVDQYLGFAVFTSGEIVSNGWMKVSVNTENKTLAVKELAFQNFKNFHDQPSLEIGKTSTEECSIALNSVLDRLLIRPNPIEDFIEFDLYYIGDEQLHFSIYNSAGKLMFRKTSRGYVSYSISTASWDNGQYFLNFKSINGVKTKKILVVK